MIQSENFSISGQIVDVVNQTIERGELYVDKGKIAGFQPSDAANDWYIMPGFIDSHVHIESSMLIPSEFARLAVTHGTVATVSDPHEIGNVLGVDGVKYMIENGKKVPFKFYFGAPSCVPATPFETAGAEIDVKDIEALMAMDDIRYLAEVMNFPGVLERDDMVMAKIAAAQKHHKVVDGHAPGLRGDAAKRYIHAGISTDHECFGMEEALDKLKYGMKISIREGSAAKNFDALIELLHQYPDLIMFCSDDKHPNDLVLGHINQLAKRAAARKIDVMKILRATSYNVVKHYGLDVGLLQPGDPADFIVVDDLRNFNVRKTFINGLLVAADGKSYIHSVEERIVNNFNIGPIAIDQIQVPAAQQDVKVIQVEDGQLITHQAVATLPTNGSFLHSDTKQDVLKLVVVNRYADAPPAMTFVTNFGLKKGALASSVGHDSHNIIAVGIDDADIVKAINLLVQHKGGVSLALGDEEQVLPLPVAGLMSTLDGYEVAAAYDAIDRRSKELGVTLASPYMTLSFLALLVIPELKLSDKGLFDGKKFEFVSLYQK